MKASLADLLARLPRPATVEWPDGVFDVEGLAHGSMSLRVFAPRGTDRQRPHAQDGLYIVAQGSSDVVLDGERTTAQAGEALFVAAGTEHRFEAMSDDFAAWVVFWGPVGGEAPAPDISVFAAIDA